MTNRSTIKDVAAKAGVSVATVSFVMNNNSGQPIGDVVRARVQRVARELNYHLNASAAHLARESLTFEGGRDDGARAQYAP